MLRTLAGVVLAVALLAACAGTDAGTGDGGAAGGGSDPTTTPGTAPPAPTTPTSTTAPGSPGKRQITATGTLRDGVEPGCVVLRTEQGTEYLLVGGDRSKLTAGGRVQVTGMLSQDLLSICQEGQPLLVSSVKPVP